MSIDFSFHSSLSFVETNKRMKRAKSDVTEIWGNGFIFHNLKEARKLDQEILLEEGYEFETKSIFRVTLNDKNLASQIVEMVDIVKGHFEKGKLLVLHQNETKI